jgi:hypothetical protein
MMSSVSSALREIKRGPASPAVLVFIISALVVGVTIWRAGGDALVLARIGTRYFKADPSGSEGYDGQFVYYIARQLDPKQVSPLLDVPAYRYQRILLPLLGRLFSFGRADLIPWTLVVINLLSLSMGTWIVGKMLAGWSISAWYSLVYGLWAGFLLALIVDLPEPLAFGLVGAGLLAHNRRHEEFAWVFFGLALFAKEVTILFIGALLFSYLLQRRWRDAIGLTLVGVLPFLIFQVWLWSTFGRLGIGSGGAMSTSFEVIPYMGLFRIGQTSIIYFLAMMVVFGPTIVLPSAWGIWKSMRLWVSGERGVLIGGLFLNGLAIAAMPFSTFRETGGILRFACGLVLALLLFAGRYRTSKVLNYTLFWLVLNVFLLK